jgi:hypothetical protein
VRQFDWCFSAHKRMISLTWCDALFKPGFELYIIVTAGRHGASQGCWQFQIPIILIKPA